LTFGWASARERRAAERAAREIELIDDLCSGSYSWGEALGRSKRDTMVSLDCSRAEARLRG